MNVNHVIHLFYWNQSRIQDYVLIHEYLVNFSFEKFKEDINTSIGIFNKKLGYNPIFFSYPFGEFNLKQVEFIKKNFKYGFGQHSGIIDFTKNAYELPRFPINEKYGDLKRFEFILNLFPIPYKKLDPIDKFQYILNPLPLSLFMAPAVSAAIVNVFLSQVFGEEIVYW